MNITRFEIEKWYLKYEFSSKYNLSASGIDPNGLEGLQAADRKIAYLPVNGSEQLRGILAAKYNLLPDNILVTNGAIEALFLVQAAMIEKGDRVVCVKPVYPALYQIAKDLGAEVFFWAIDIENSLTSRPDINRLLTLIKQHRPKLVILNFPNNPTGITISDSELKDIVSCAEKYNSFVLADEVYKDIDNETADYFSRPNLIRVSSLSKAYGFPGLRTGWLAADKTVIGKCLNLKHYTTICNNFFSDYYAVQVLEKTEYYLQKTATLVKLNRELTLKKLENWKSRFQLDYVFPDTGLTVFVKLMIPDTEPFCQAFEAAESILLLPGNKYSDEYRQFFRLGFGIETERLEYCLDRLEKFLTAYFR